MSGLRTKMEAYTALFLTFKVMGNEKMLTIVSIRRREASLFFCKFIGAAADP